jgi:hypothetical protein
MKIEELIKEVKNLNYNINLNTYNIWDDYWYNIIWWEIVITIPKHIKEKKRDLQVILNAIHWYWKNIPTTYELSYVDSIEWLYSHYKYWIDYNSNCILLNTHFDIIAISYNWLKDFDIIMSDILVNKDYIVFNLNTKIKWNYKYKDLEKLITENKPLFTNKKKLCVE